MAGSYGHCVDADSGRLLDWPEFLELIDHLGDAYEAIEEMYWMIQHLSGGDRDRINAAILFWRDGRNRCRTTT